jgi:hypothetical protein
MRGEGSLARGGGKEVGCVDQGEVLLEGCGFHFGYTKCGQKVFRAMRANVFAGSSPPKMVCSGVHFGSSVTRVLDGAPLQHQLQTLVWVVLACQ